MKFQKITFLAISLLAFDKTRAAIFCGKNSNTKCPDGYCCSKFGTCGKSEFYCGKGCQAKYGKCKSTTYTKTTKIGPIETGIPENACGPKYGNKKCPGNECCNKNGQCGFDLEYCGKGCQSEFGYCLPEDFKFPICLACVNCVNCTDNPYMALACPNTCMSEQKIKKIKNEEQEQEKEKEQEQKEEENTCGPKYGNKTCPGSQCCSKDGKCGFSIDHCGAGCQSEFGYYCLPENYDNFMCVQCMECANCEENPQMSLICPRACASTFDYTKERKPKTTTTSKPEPEPTVTEDVCGPKHGNKKCPGSQCCSKDGKCGFSKDHCGVGCQSEFGYYCLPKDYENVMCLECMGCVNCEDNPQTSLVCPHACSSTFDYKKERKPKATTISKPKPRAVEDVCGPKYGNKTCPGSQCCSKDGKCGFSMDHCGAGCQSEFGYYCLPENYENIMCIQCMECANCEENPQMSLICPRACASTFDYTKERKPKTTTTSKPEPEPTVTEDVCGPKHGNKKCPGSQCCSKDGKCGFSKGHCGAGCQSEFGYYCLPENYDNFMCVKCMGCVNCEENPQMSLVCPNVCSSTFDYKKEREPKTSTTTTTTTTTEEKPIEIVKPEPSVPENACGPKYGNKKCPGNECCGANGQCGFDKKQCGVGCQSEFGYCLPENYENFMCIQCYGCVDCSDNPMAALICPSTCKENIQSKPAVTVTKTRTIRPLPSNESKNVCGPKHGNKKCPENECCNSRGECGFDTKHCGKGCQSEFGYCLPSGYEGAACIQCVGCVDCKKNPYMALVCPRTCRKLAVM